MATITKSITLKHQGNLGVDVEEFRFEPGAEITILKEWQDHYFCRDEAGNVFNIRKEFVDPS